MCVLSAFAIRKSMITVPMCVGFMVHNTHIVQAVDIIKENAVNAERISRIIFNLCNNSQY